MARVVRYNKYGAKKVTIDGIRFDSKMEAKRYGELRLMAVAGKIAMLKVHPVFFITVENISVCKVILDFQYYAPTTLRNYGNPVYEDVKGKDNALSRLKRKLVEAQYGIKVSVVKGK